MLYDPRWEVKKPKRRAFSLEGLIAWLENQPADRSYDYVNVTGHCLLGQYARSAGFRGISVGPASLHYLRFFIVPWTKEIPHEINSIAARHPWTFGAALERAKAA